VLGEAVADGVAVGCGVAVGAGVALGFGVGDGVGVGLASRPIETAEKIAVRHSNFRNECSLIFGAKCRERSFIEILADASNFGNFGKLNHNQLLGEVSQTGSAYGSRTRAPALRGPCPNH
jgi:hypothetical protein